MSEVTAPEDGQDQINNKEEFECRTCLIKFSSDDRLHNLFEPWFSPFETSTNIAEDLSKLTSVEISINDRHSKLICSRCISRLHNACTFILSVQDNEKFLQLRVSTIPINISIWPKPIQVEKNINGDSGNVELNHEIKQEVESEEETENSNGVNDYRMEIKIEPEELIESRPEFFVNGVNESDFDTVINMNGDSHNSDVTIKEEPLSEEELESTKNLPAECILCAKQFRCITGLKAHVIANHSYKTVRRKPNNQPLPEKHKTKHLCVICRRRFSTPTDLMVHGWTCHNKVICYGCNEKFDDFKMLLKHRRRCKLSPKVVPEPNTLDDVVRKQNPLNKKATISCSECNMVFTDIYYYNVHQELHKTCDSDEDKSSSPASPTSPIQIEALESIFTGESEDDAQLTDEKTWVSLNFDKTNSDQYTCNICGEVLTCKGNPHTKAEHLQSCHTEIFEQQCNTEEAMGYYSIEFLDLDELDEDSNGQPFKSQGLEFERVIKHVDIEDMLTQVRENQERTRETSSPSSWVWEYFDQIGRILFRCNLCNIYLSSSNVHNMKRHIRIEHHRICDGE